MAFSRQTEVNNSDSTRKEPEEQILLLQFLPMFQYPAYVSLWPNPTRKQKVRKSFAVNNRGHPSWVYSRVEKSGKWIWKEKWRIFNTYTFPRYGLSLWPSLPLWCYHFIGAVKNLYFYLVSLYTVYGEFLLLLPFHQRQAQEYVSSFCKGLFILWSLVH